MTDNELAILIRAQLLAGLERIGVTAAVVANYQPTTQGRVDGPTIYFHHVADRRYGWQGKRQIYDPLQGRITRTEEQIIETTFQCMALSEADPSDLSKPTAKDLVNYAALVINSASFVEALKPHGVGVQRIMSIRNPHFVNDQGQFEASPSFDFVVTHRRAIIEQAPAANSVEVNTFRV